MYKRIMDDLVGAAQTLLAPPNMVNPMQRQGAAATFTHFKRHDNPYRVCRYILDECKVDYVLFEVADAIKEALIREWRLVAKEEIDSLLEYLLNYVTKKVPPCPAFVREKILQVIAIITKRRSCEDDGAQREALLTEIENMIWSGDHEKKIVGCSMLSAIVLEHSITPKSTYIGLTIKQNFLVKEQFEVSDLKKVFQFCIKGLSNLANVEDPLPPESESLAKQLLNLSEVVLTWNFTPATRLFSTLNYQLNPNTKLKLPRGWQDVVLDNMVVNLYFTVYWKIRSIPTLAHHCMSCLVQFASLQGGIFDTDEKRAGYFKVYIEGFLKLIENTTILDREAIGMANMVRELLNVLPEGLLPGIPGELLENFMEQIIVMTCNFCEAAANEECTEDKLYMEAFDHLVESWLNALSIQTEDWKNLCGTAAIRIFTIYLRCHLAPAEGFRVDRPMLEGNGYGDDDEETDRVKFKDQLQNMGEVGRHCLDYSVPMVTALLESRSIPLMRLVAHLTANESRAQADPREFRSLYEDVNWLLLISGSILSYGTNEIPTDVMKYSVSKAVNTNIEVTTQLFEFPHLGPMDFGSHEAYFDPVIRLISATLRYTKMFKDLIDMKMVMFVSPELVSTSLWFLKRFTSSYLMFNEQMNTELSIAFVCTFGRDSEGAAWAVNHLLELVNVFLDSLNVEPDVVEESLDLFIALVDTKEKARHVLKSEYWKRMMRMLPNVRLGIKREIVRGLTLAGAALRDCSSEDEYWMQVVKPISDQLQSLLNRPDYSVNYQSEIVKFEIVDVLECLIGVAMGSTSHTSPIIFGHLLPVMKAMPDLMESYHGHQQVVELILLVLVKCATHFVSYLPHSLSKHLYEASLYTIQRYSRYHSNRLKLDSSSEEDCFRDLLLIMELLSNLFTKDIFDFTRSDSVEVVERPLIAADVCLHGLKSIMPLVKSDLLKFPELSIQYYKLISYVCQFYPAKIMDLDERMLTTVLSSIEFGLNATGEEVIPYCCDFIHFLGIHLYTTADGRPTNPILKPFLKLLTSMAFSHQVNDSFLPKTSAAIFVLICCYKEDYMEIIQSVMQSQREPAVKELLAKAFVSLTENVPLKFQRQNQHRFRKNFETFLVEVRGFFNG